MQFGRCISTRKNSTIIWSCCQKSSSRFAHLYFGKFSLPLMPSENSSIALRQGGASSAGHDACKGTENSSFHRFHGMSGSAAFFINAGEDASPVKLFGCFSGHQYVVSLVTRPLGSGSQWFHFCPKCVNKHQIEFSALSWQGRCHPDKVNKTGLRWPCQHKPVFSLRGGVYHRQSHCQCIKSCSSVLELPKWQPWIKNYSAE